MTPAADQMTVKPPSLAILIAISWVSPLALNIFVPSMPGIISALNTDAETVQLALSLFLASVALSQLVLGPLSDMFGRRPVVLAGMSVFFVATAMCAFAPSIDVLIGGRILQAAGGCAGIVLARSIVRDLFEREKAASMIGYVTAGMAVAPLMAPAIGGLLDEYFGWRASFFLVAALGAGILVFAWVDLPETNIHRSKHGGFGRMLSGIATLSSYKMFWAYTLTLCFATAVFFSFLGGAPFISSKVLGLSPSGYGLYFAIIAFGYMSGNFLSGRFAERLGIMTLILIGGFVCLSGTLAMTAAFSAEIFHPLALFGPMFFVSLANGMVIPSTLAGAVSVRPDIAGAASGYAGSLQMSGGALATWLITIAITNEAGEIVALPLALTATTFAAIAVLCGLATWLLVRRQGA